MLSKRNESNVYELTKRAIEESESRVASLQREISLLNRIIAQNRAFLERIDLASRTQSNGNVPLLDRIGGSVKIQAGAGETEQRAGTLAQPRADDKRLRGGRTYAASILEVLSNSPRGMTTAELTEYFRSVHHPISTREDAGKAVSNQLSQLKQRRLVVRDENKRFTIVEN